VGDAARTARDDLAGRLDDGSFVPELVQPEGRGKMSYDEFVRGVR